MLTSTTRLATLDLRETTMCKLIRASVVLLAASGLASACHSPQDNADGIGRSSAERAEANRQAAEQGDADAQYQLGVMYDHGQGVIKDQVLAHMWFNIAGANGSEAAREQRDRVEGGLTRAEISRATELARACVASDYRDCAL